jgi:hypothetical protein
MTGTGKTKSGIHRCPPFPVPFTTKPKTKYLNNKIPKLGTLKIKGCLKLWPCHFTLQSILRQKKSYGTSNISPCKNIIFKNSSKRNGNPSRYYNSIITNLKFQHQPTYHLSKILI